MGKPRKDAKFGQPVAAKVPLDEQIVTGKVAKTKGKFKIRLRAEEEGVSETKLGKSQTIY